MVRSLWKGDISFGLVSIPVAIVPVEERKSLHFHLLDAEDHARIRYERVNTNTGRKVPWDHIVKGYEYEKDNYIVVDEEAFAKASPEVFKSISIEEFVDLNNIDTLFFDKAYYLVPDSKNKKAYVLLREALKKTNKVGIARVIIRTREYLSLITSHDNALLLMILHFQEEIRQEEDFNFPSGSLQDYKITDKEMKMAISLINDMASAWQPEKYHDDYRQALQLWLDKKIAALVKSPNKGGQSRKGQDDVIDFISLLKKSMGKTKGKIKKSASK